MFGWLAARSPSSCHLATYPVRSRRIRRIAPRALIEALPGLGSVLYLHAAANMSTQHCLLRGVLAQRAFMPLLSAHWLVSISVVTDDGPREWCECVDALGCTQARWHLLPDTDYLAWDGLTAACVANSSLPARTQALRPDSASVVSFRLRQCAGLLLLEQAVSPSLSPLGDRLATRLALAESVVRRA